MAQEVCYWPNGLAVDSSISGLRYWPCHHGTSSCCAEGEACLSNGLCYSPAIDSVRATFSWYTVCILKNLPRHIAALALIQAGRNVPTNIATTFLAINRPIYGNAPLVIPAVTEPSGAVLTTMCQIQMSVKLMRNLEKSSVGPVQLC